ncbi:MAG: response regulator [Fimbriimonas sp.]
MESKSILVVEDNADDEQLTLRALRHSKNPASAVAVPNVIHIARDGAEALDMLVGPSALSPLPDLVLLDLKLPKLNGLEVLARLSDTSRSKRPAVVVLTSSDEERDISRCYELGANSYIRKPVDFDEFLDAVRQIMSYWLLVNQAPQK